MTDNNDFDAARDEFNYISSHTEGRSGCSYKSSNGYEFVIWIDNEDEPPPVESELIEVVIDRDDPTYEDRFKFSMTLPYNE